MTYIGHYQSPLGDILIAVDEIGVYGLWFENQKYYASGLIEPYEEKEKELGDRVRELERIVVLRTVDEKWIDYLDAMEQLKESVRLQGYAQKDPVVEFQRESYDYFNEMTSSIDETVVKTMLHLVPREKVERVNLIRNMVMNMQAAQQAGGPEKPQPKTNKSEKVGRNDPCPCGSGKKYKQCCGK